MSLKLYWRWYVFSFAISSCKNTVRTSASQLINPKSLNSCCLNYILKTTEFFLSSVYAQAPGPNIENNPLMRTWWYCRPGLPQSQTSLYLRQLTVNTNVALICTYVAAFLRNQDGQILPLNFFFYLFYISDRSYNYSTITILQTAISSIMEARATIGIRHK